MYTNSTTYSTPRLLHFVMRQQSLFRQGWLIAAAAVLGLMLLGSLLKAYYSPAELPEMRGLYYGILLLVGLIFSSQMFQELHSPSRSWAYLTLPASTLEKLLSAWLISSPLFILVFTAATFFIYLISCAITGFSVSPFSYFSPEYWETLSSYLIVQTIFLWGACYFRKNNFLKTVLALVVLLLTLGAFLAIVALLLFGTPGGDANIVINPDTHWLNQSLSASLQFWINTLLQIAFAFYMLVMTYFTLKEREV